MTEIKPDSVSAYKGLAVVLIVYFHMLLGLQAQYPPLINTLLQQAYYFGIASLLLIAGFRTAIWHKNSYLQKSSLNHISYTLLKLFIPYWWHLLFALMIIPVLSGIVSALKSHTLEFEFVSIPVTEWPGILTLGRIFSADSWELNIIFSDINGVVWLVAVFAQIYIFIAFCLAFNKRFFNILMFSGFIVSLLSNVAAINPLIPAGIFLPFFAIFYLGYYIYFIYINDFSHRYTNLNFLALAICTIIAVLFSAQSKPSIFIGFSIPGALILITILRYQPQLYQNFFIKVFAIIGLFSYSLYLLHFPLSEFFNMFIRNLVPLPPSIANPLILVPSIIIASYLWYLFFEKPDSLTSSAKNILSPIKTISTNTTLIFNHSFNKKNNQHHHEK